MKSSRITMPMEMSQKGSTIAGQIIHGTVIVDKQNVQVHIYPSKESIIRIESFNIKDPLDTDEGEDRTISELHKEIKAAIESNVKNKKINSFIWPITGIAGSGKTQYALKYVYKYKHEYDHCYLINASTVQTAEKSFLDIESDLKARGIYRNKERGNVLKTVQNTFEEGKQNSEVLPHLIILTGMPGIGKSETARMYVHKRKSDYAIIIWINAKTPELIYKSFSEVSQKHQLTFNNLERHKKDAKGLAREVYKQLCQMTLLIVFDGASSWNGENGIRHFMPMDIKRGWKTPDVIVTSSNRN
ncbi:unnamed protein product [Allacma fusca]|uniref:NB-ARC domain-containing protein n=1 Tax=Allacma fusca TaxID=39272 RepID=A0A8J2K886_9HEXA|nr:unnamed protein product [Allacma fusca]